MTRKQPPYFPFYPADLLSDTNVTLMALDELGAYLLLMCACWIEGSLPKDAKLLASIARMPLKRFSRSWEGPLGDCFVFDQKKNVYRHPRLMRELQKQKAFRKQKSEAGKASARKRGEIKVLQSRGDRTGVQRPFGSAPTNFNSSSSSSSSSSKTEHKNVRVGGSNGEFQNFLDEVLNGLRAAMNVVSLRDEPLWVIQCEWAYENRYTPDDFLECFRLLRSQDWRTSRVTPTNVADNLPELKKRRSQLHGPANAEALPDLIEVESRRREARALPAVTECAKEENQ